MHDHRQIAPLSAAHAAQRELLPFPGEHLLLGLGFLRLRAFGAVPALAVACQCINPADNELMNLARSDEYLGQFLAACVQADGVLDG